MKILRMLLIIFVISNCANNKYDQDIVKNEIKQLLNRQVDLWNKGDVAGFMKEYLNSSETTYTSGGKIIKGWININKRFLDNYKENDTGVLSFDKLEITPLNRKTGFVLGNWYLKRRERFDEGVFTLILKKVPEGWKIIHDHTSVIQMKE